MMNVTQGELGSLGPKGKKITDVLSVTKKLRDREQKNKASAKNEAAVQRRHRRLVEYDIISKKLQELPPTKVHIDMRDMISFNCILDHKIPGNMGKFEHSTNQGTARTYLESLHSASAETLPLIALDYAVILAVRRRHDQQSSGALSAPRKVILSAVRSISRLSPRLPLYKHALRQLRDDLSGLNSWNLTDQQSVALRARCYAAQMKELHKIHSLIRG